MSSLADLVDLDRYPIHELDGAEAQELLRNCRDALRADGAVRLDGFVRADAVAEMAAEATALAPLGFPNDARHNCYFDDEIVDSLPEDHPRRILVRSAQKAVAMDLLPPDFGPRRIYGSEEGLRFGARRRLIRSRERRGSSPRPAADRYRRAPTRSTAAT